MLLKHQTEAASETISMREREREREKERERETRDCFKLKDQKVSTNVRFIWWYNYFQGTNDCSKNSKIYRTCLKLKIKEAWSMPLQIDDNWDLIISHLW